MALSLPRDRAVRILGQVLGEKRPLDEVLDEFQAGLDPKHAGWLQDVCAGTLRWRGRCDSAIDSVAIKKKPTGWLRRVLLIAAYQLIVQDRVEAAFVVSETVDLVRSQEGEAPAKFANALLRKIADHAKEWRDLKFPQQGNDEEQARWASLPVWMWKRLLKDHGFAWTQAFAQASLDRPTLWVRMKPGQDEGVNWKVGPVPGSFSVEARCVIGDSVLVQDISNQKLVAEVVRVSVALGRSLPSLRVLDVCASPGGKSVGLSWSGFQVDAMEKSDARRLQLERNLARLAPEVRVIPFGRIENPYDVVWVDAPCSGSGILRRHPDVRWLRDEKELGALESAQKELIANARTWVKPGGLLVYSVCSVFKAEGPGVFSDAQASLFLEPQGQLSGDGFWCGWVVK